MKALVVLAVALGLTACSVVAPGERGVRVTLGTVSEDPKEPGIYLWIPFVMKMTKIDVQIQKSEIASTAASKDMQDVHATVAINWSLSPENVVRTYKTIGTEYDVEMRILNPAVNEVMKAATAKRTAEEVLTHRMETKKDIDEGLVSRLKQYGITLHDVSITNLKFSNGYTEAIEHKQVAELEAQQAVFITQRATQEAKAEIERAKGTSQAQALMKATITKEILQQRAIEKWDGKFPHFMGSSALPFINFKGE